MVRTDCIKCWDTPCTCGYGYRNMCKDARLCLASVILGVYIKTLEIRLSDVLFDNHPRKGEK